MANILSLDILDVARALGRSPFSTSPTDIRDWLRLEYARSSGGGFNYDPAINATYDGFRGGHTVDSAVNICAHTGNPKGRTQNASAIKAAMPYILEHPSVCHHVGMTAMAVGRFSGRTVYAKIKAPLVRVENDKAFMVMPGFRMSHRPSDVAIDFACSVALEVLSDGETPNADFEYLFAGPSDVGKGRMFKAIHGVDRHRFDLAAINRLLEIYVKGVALAVEEAGGADKPDLSGYRIIDPDAPRFL